MVHTQTESKVSIKDALAFLATDELRPAAGSFFQALGYESARSLEHIIPSQPKAFVGYMERAGFGDSFTTPAALTDEWTSVEFLFQFTADELLRTDPRSDFEEGRIQSFLFAAIGLKERDYSRTKLAGVARTLNRSSPIPIVVLFRHGYKVSLAYIHRRPGKREPERDVLEKVSIIKDIECAKPHRGHLDLLHALHQGPQQARSFDALQEFWEKTLDTSLLNKRFYQQLSNWYFWARDHVSFPDDLKVFASKEERNSVMTIRLITRIIFIWFLREKGLIPDNLFDEENLSKVIRDFAAKKKNNANYYRAILQNLFFATLNRPMQERAFAQESRTKSDGSKHYGVKSLYRYQDHFQDSVSEADALALFKDIPFLNGGLFDCLDVEDQGRKSGRSVANLDGFSRDPKKQAVVPDFLFFGPEIEVDLSAEYGEKRRRSEKVQGLYHILDGYKFTIAENTPLEEEVALDPELLGKVFENLLASYNPETKTTARKATGSFYTPREIVDYMVDESLIAVLADKLDGTSNSEPEEAEALLRKFFAGEDESLSPRQREVLVESIFKLKVLDPACGSGAFPMGVLHRMTDLLRRADPDNRRWRELQLLGTEQNDSRYATELERIKADLATTRQIQDTEARAEAERILRTRRDRVIDSFELEAPDYARKLYLIENCIYGVDIQPIAVQIAKLRFFISLVVDQNVSGKVEENRGILALPNLETKFVAANTLVALEASTGTQAKDDLFDRGATELQQHKNRLREVRHRYFAASDRTTKLACAAEDARIRGQIASYLADTLKWESAVASAVSSWNPYDQNHHADWFDPEWMFGVRAGFDVVIGNPPYGLLGGDRKAEREYFRKSSAIARYKINTYVLFIERGIALARQGGLLFYIVPKSLVFNVTNAEARRMILRRAWIRQLVEIDGRVFDAAEVGDSVLFAAQNVGNPLDQTLNLIRMTYGPPLTVASKVTASQREQADSKNATFVATSLQTSGPIAPLGHVVAVNNGLNPGNVRRRLFAEKKLTSKHRKLLLGKDINRFRIAWSGTWINYDPSLKKRLTPEDTRSKPGMPKQKRVDFALRDPAIFEPANILIRKTGDRILAAYDDSGFCFDSLSYGLKPKGGLQESLFYLLGLLNSSFFWFKHEELARSRGKVFAKVLAKNLRELPVRRIDFQSKDETAMHDAIVSAVERIIRSKEKGNQDTSHLEREIDQHVYRLYDLSPDEIRTVEEYVGQ